jgi:hypothetical protein
MRHREMAHRDYATALEEHPQPIGRVKSRVLKSALVDFAEILTAISNQRGLNLTYTLDEVANLDVHLLLEMLRGRGCGGQLDGPAVDGTPSDGGRVPG